MGHSYKDGEIHCSECRIWIPREEALSRTHRNKFDSSGLYRKKYTHFDFDFTHHKGTKYAIRDDILANIDKWERLISKPEILQR